MYAFVYGTLRKGDSRFGVLNDCKCIAEEAYLDGFIMLNLGSFPGIIPGEGRIRGEIYEIDEDVLAQLDSIEGYRDDDPKHSLYIRTVVDAFYDDGGSVPTGDDRISTYVYNADRFRSSDRPYNIVESGDWFDVSPPRALSTS
jgi:gamma-glutamylcyclotransferase (GGCT)/AIG2-like uncharacterized protein YtfP